MPETQSKASVFLVDDHPLVRESLTNLINQQPDMSVCGEAGSAAEAIRGVVARKPRIVIMDISLKETSGLELLKAVRINEPRTDIIVLSMHDEKLYAERCIRGGARGYVMKGESTKRIIAAIRAVLSGNICISEEMNAVFAKKQIGFRFTPSASPLETLSDRELEVFNLLGRGLETRQVAGTLNISIKTVHAYCARIKQKLQVSTATELLREAIRWHERQAN